MDFSNEELLIAVIARLLKGDGHIAVGVLSPIPGSAAMLAQACSRTPVKVSIIGSRIATYRTDGGVDFFDCAGQGRLDTFFLSGGQIDGHANINLLGVGAYPGTTARWSGCFGSAYLYLLVPKVILLREEHTKRTLVEQVDFISAPGSSPANVYRPGGPHALVTSRCLFMFERDLFGEGKGGFRLASLHPGVTIEEVRDNTGFEFACPSEVPQTPVPDAATLALIRGEVAGRIADPYPRFASKVLGFEARAT